jgi:putative CocE/NonD family hydrolase
MKSRCARFVTLVAGTGVALVSAGGATAASLPAASPPAAVVSPAAAAPNPVTAATSPEIPKSVVRASAARGKHWKPQKARYGTASHNDLGITMKDGTVIRANVIYPTTANGKEAKGKFPVLLTQTPYGKQQGGSSAPGSASTPGGASPTGGADNYLVQRGFIEVVADVRGTGNSSGSWGLFDPSQTRDGIRLVHWAAKRAHSNGKVGTYGPSYLGINQMLLAGSIGKHSPLKAIFPVVSATDIYRDTSFMGGLLDSEFDVAYLGLTGGLNLANPVGDALQDPTDQQVLAELGQVEADHANGIASYHAKSTENIVSGGSDSFDGTYWHARQPGSLLKHIVANKIPAYLVGGEFDIFQRGEPMNYAGLQNAFDGRRTLAPMKPGQRVTGRYQLADGPWEHINGSSVDADPLELEWFDTWLKGQHTGMAKTKTPLHYYDLGTKKFAETTTYPFTKAAPTRLFFGNSTLSAAKPTAGTDTLLWSPAGSPCGRAVDQWSLGGVSIATQAANVSAPCVEDDRAGALPLITKSYTTAPLAHPERLAGPIAATVYMSATTTDTELVAEVEDVAPDGTSRPLTEGALLGSFRKVDAAKSWKAPGGQFLLPFHDYTKASQQAVVPGALTRNDIEIFPTFATLAKGHSLRITLSTADTPHLTPNAKQLPHLVGGVYTVSRGGTHASSLEVPLQRVR